MIECISLSYDVYLLFEFFLVQARAIESSLKGKLAEAPLCDESNNIEKEIRQKKLLKATVAKLVNCVTSECEPNMGALRTALQVSRHMESNCKAGCSRRSFRTQFFLHQSFLIHFVLVLGNEGFTS